MEINNTFSFNNCIDLLIDNIYSSPLMKISHLFQFESKYFSKIFMIKIIVLEIYIQNTLISLKGSDAYIWFKHSYFHLIG